MSHQFSNGSCCLMKLRCKKVRYIDPINYPKIYGLGKENFYKIVSIPLENFNSQDMVQAINNSHINHVQSSIAPILANLMEQKSDPWAKDYLLHHPLDCEIFTFLCAKKGKILLFVKNNCGYIKFAVECLKKEEEGLKDNRLMLKYKHGIDSKVIKSWKIHEMHSLYKKHIVDTKTGLEIKFTTGKTVFFNFASEEGRDTFFTKLLKLREKTCKDKFTSYYDGINSFEKMKYTEQWKNGILSTFDYIMILNNLSSRSYHNSSQYPVYPWTITDYTSENLQINEINIYRDFTKNVGMMGNELRKEDFINRFSQPDLMGLGHFHFGSHYSNPAIVLQFMMRIFPYFEGYVKFFSGFDDPNRMFHSIHETYISACKDPSDVRELIPEFFTFPIMFTNIEETKFGAREDDKQDVNNIVLPPWAGGSPMVFVMLLRQALESKNTSAGLPKWIDLIFGFQQRGKEAEKAINTFSPLTFEPAKVLMKMTGEVRDEFRLQAFHWGQTPQQLLTKPHCDRLPITKISVMECKSFWNIQ